MTLLLGAIAALLLIALVALVAHQSRADETLGFTLPAHMEAGNRAAQPGSISIAPTAVMQPSLENDLAARYAANVQMSGSPERQISNFMPGNLGVGTTLTYNGKTSSIIGVLSFDFEGDLWQDYFAESTTGEWWRFGVEPNRDFRLHAFVPHPIAVEPGPQSITFAGEVYQKTEGGIAHFRAAGNTGTFETGRYHYFDYENTNGTILSFERFDHSEWKTSTGQRVNPAAVTVCNELPASPGSASSALRRPSSHTAGL